MYGRLRWWAWGQEYRRVANIHLGIGQGQRGVDGMMRQGIFEGYHTS